MSAPTGHNLDLLKPQLTGFGQHIAHRPKSERTARIAQLKQILLDASGELEQLMQEG